MEVSMEWSSGVTLLLSGTTAGGGPELEMEPVEAERPLNTGFSSLLTSSEGLGVW